MALYISIVIKDLCSSGSSIQPLTCSEVGATKEVSIGCSSIGCSTGTAAVFSSSDESVCAIGSGSSVSLVNTSSDSGSSSSLEPPADCA